MATSLNGEPQDTVDPLDAITDRLEARFGSGDEDHDEDDDREDANDGGGEEDSTDDRPAAESDEHPASNTDSDPDGDQDEIDDDSDDQGEGDDADDDDDHTGDEPESTDDDADDAAEGDGEGSTDGDEEGVSDETKAALVANGADLSLADVPEEYRPVLEKKLRSMDAAFTRYAQEATAYRAEQRYRDAHPELVIVELLQSGGDEVMQAVNAYLDSLDGDEAAKAKGKEALEQTIAEARKSAQAEVDAAIADEERRNTRAHAIESYARTKVEAVGLTFGATLERAIVAELMAKPEDARDLTDAELDAIIGDYVKEHQHLVRKGKRAESRDIVRSRTAGKRQPAPTVRTPRGAASPNTTPPVRKKVNWEDQDERLAALEESAKRITARRRG